MHFAIHGDRFGFYLTPNFSVFTDRQNAVRVNIPFDLSVDEKFLLELNRAFYFDIAREDVFATMICHRFWIWVIDYCWCWCWFFATRRMIVIIYIRIPGLFFDRRHRLLRDESFEHPIDCDTRRCLSTDSRL